MRHVKVIVGLAVTVCALGITAVPALAFTEFFASAAGEVKGKAVSEEQVFKFGPVTKLNDKFTIKCISARSKGGEVSEGVFGTLEVPVRFGKCTSEGKGAAFLHQKEEPLEFGYTFEPEENEKTHEIKYFVDADTTSAAEHESIEIKLPVAKCIVTLEPNSLERAPVSIENATAEPKGKSKFEQHSLIIKDAFKDLKYKVRSSVTNPKAPKGVCGEEAKAENGSYTGALKYELNVKEGNLEALPL